PGVRDRRRRLVALTQAGAEARVRLEAIRRRRADGVLERVLAATGLHEGQAEWFLRSLLDAFVEPPEATS
ncbi:MAG: hypothetical protein O2894_12060, partial [Planctomycetota bacterium]|nr:hypothetical protein [Planctomycetota bacterium]